MLYEKNRISQIILVLFICYCLGKCCFTQTKVEKIDAIEKLSPKVVFPMHCGGSEFIYTQFAKDAMTANLNVAIVSAEFRGDRYFYESGQIQ